VGSPGEVGGTLHCARLSNEKLLEWQMCLRERFLGYASYSDRDFYNVKVHFAMHQFMKEVENSKVDSKSMKLLCARASQFFCPSNTHQYHSFYCRGQAYHAC